MNSDNSNSCRLTQILLLVSLLFMGLGLGLPLLNQVRQFNRDLPVGRKIVADFQTNNEPKIKQFVTNLQNFAKANPDFAQIFAKYNVQSGPAPAPAATPSTTLPVKK
jgi:hypothetical protein